MFFHQGAKKIHSCKAPVHHHRKNTEVTFKSITVKWKLILILFTVLCILNKCIWTPQDTRTGKNRQRNQKFTPFNYESFQEKELFNKIRKLETNLSRTESHLQFFRQCLQFNIFPKNLHPNKDFSIAFSKSNIESKISDIEINSMYEKVHCCVGHYQLISIKLKEEINEERYKLQQITSKERFKTLDILLNTFNNKLTTELCTKKLKKFQKLEKEQSKIQDKEFWISSLNLRNQQKKDIQNNTDLCDAVILAAMNLLQQDYPHIVTQPPALVQCTGYTYCPADTIQITHKQCSSLAVSVIS